MTPRISFRRCRAAKPVPSGLDLHAFKKSETKDALRSLYAGQLEAARRLNQAHGEAGLQAETSTSAMTEVPAFGSRQGSPVACVYAVHVSLLLSCKSCF